jgi:hypothetical protein
MKSSAQKLILLLQSVKPGQGKGGPAAATNTSTGVKGGIDPAALSPRK